MEKRIDELYNLACTIKYLVEENDKLKSNNKYLKEQLDNYDNWLRENLKTHQENAADILKTLVNDIYEN